MTTNDFSQKASSDCVWHNFTVDQLNELSMLIEWAHERRRQWSAWTNSVGWAITIELKRDSNEAETIRRYYLSLDIPDSQEANDA